MKDAGGMYKSCTDHFIGPVHVRVQTSQQGLENYEYQLGIRVALAELRQHLRWLTQAEERFLKSPDAEVNRSSRAKHPAKPQIRSGPLRASSGDLRIVPAV